MLSPEERERLLEQANIVSEVYQLTQGQTGRRESKRYIFLNSPFVITFLGGFIVALLSLFLQQRFAANAVRVTRDQQLQDKKYALLADFSAHFESYYMLMNRAVRGEPQQAYKEYLASNYRFDSDIAQIKALFESAGVMTEVEALFKTVELEFWPKITGTPSARTYEEILTNSYLQFFALTSKMGVEIREPKPTLSDPFSFLFD